MFIGTPTVGHVDDLEKLKDLCKNHNIWLHVEGYVPLSQLNIFPAMHNNCCISLIYFYTSEACIANNMDVDHQGFRFSSKLVGQSDPWSKKLKVGHFLK